MLHHHHSWLQAGPAGFAFRAVPRMGLFDLHGRILARVDNANGPVSLPMPGCGMAILRMEGGAGSSRRKLVILP